MSRALLAASLVLSGLLSGLLGGGQRAWAQVSAAELNRLGEVHKALEARDTQRRLIDELGTLRAWIDELRGVDGEVAARGQARVNAQILLVEALVERDAIVTQTRPLQDEVRNLRQEAETLATAVAALTGELDESSKTVWRRRQ